MTSIIRRPSHKLGDARRHMLLVRDMARAVGADLEHAQRDGILTEADWAEMVTLCRGCADVETCERWLKQRELGVDAAPPVCGNAELLDDLANLT